eukprot:2567113-Prymnesium_polylepis.1
MAQCKLPMRFVNAAPESRPRLRPVMQSAQSQGASPTNPSHSPPQRALCLAHSAVHTWGAHRYEATHGCLRSGPCGARAHMPPDP